MANLRQLSAFSLSLSLLAGSTFSSNSQAETPPQTELKNPPPDKTVFFQSDLWQHNANKEWVFSHLILSAIRATNDTRINKLQVTDDTKRSLSTIRKEFTTPATQSKVDTASLSDLVYAYSWSNSGYLSYAFSGLQAIYHKYSDVKEYASENVSFYKQHRQTLDTAVAAGVGIPLAGVGAYKLVSPPAVNAAQGFFAKRYVLNAGKKIADKATGFWAAITAHPYVAGALATLYGGYEATMTVGNIYFDVPLAMKYYTDRIVGGDGSAQAGTYTNTFYGFSQQKAGDHFHWYINMNTFNTMLHGFLTHGKNMNQLQFGAIPPIAEELLDGVSNKLYLSKVVHTPILPDYFDLRKPEYEPARALHRKHVAELVKQVIDVNNPEDDCRKYILYNNAVLQKNSDPIYLFSLCSIGDTYAYAKLPWQPYARMKKTEALGFIQDLMEYTGSTRLVIMSEQ